MTIETAQSISLLVFFIVAIGLLVIGQGVVEHLDQKYNGIATAIGGILLAIFILFKVIEAIKVTHNEFQRKQEIQTKQQQEMIKKWGESEMFKELKHSIDSIKRVQ